MKLVYKQVKVQMPHCGVCGERLGGNNSIVNPYFCSCGEWQNSYEDLQTYNLIK